MCEKDKAKSWKDDWIEKNPVNGKTWNIKDPIVQKKLIHLLFVHKPEYVLRKAFLKGWKIKMTS